MSQNPYPMWHDGPCDKAKPCGYFTGPCKKGPVPSLVEDMERIEAARRLQPLPWYERFGNGFSRILGRLQR
jgi:hypothetical protein